MLREFDADTNNSEANSLPQAEAEKSAPNNIDSAPNQPGAAPSEDLPPEPENGFGAIFHNRNFLILWTGQLFSQLADKVYLVLMIAIIAARFETPGQTISGWVAAVMIAFTVPAVLFGAL
ncbi:MAG: arabinose efflux permease, partial [Nodosilinea sp.]